MLQNGKLAKWQVGKKAIKHNDKDTKFQVDKMPKMTGRQMTGRQMTNDN